MHTERMLRESILATEEAVLRARHADGCQPASLDALFDQIELEDERILGAIMAARDLFSALRDDRLRAGTAR